MSLIAWDERYSVGIPAVDHEHRELIRLINDAYASLMWPREQAAVADFLAEIHDRIAAHFALEERLMREQRHDRLAEHKADHERLLEEIRDIMDEYEDRASFGEQQLAERLERWFSEHFRTHDARLHRRPPPRHE